MLPLGGRGLDFLLGLLGRDGLSLLLLHRVVQPGQATLRDERQTPLLGSRRLFLLRGTVAVGE